MIDLAPYAAFIVPAYAISLLGLGLATLLTVLAWRKAKARLAALERK